MKSAAALVVLLFLFCLRVLGQFLVAFGHQGWLPPMQEWMSGLLPYPELLCSQLLIIGLFVKIIFDVYRGYGVTTNIKPARARFIANFARLYFASMVVRYVIYMGLNPDKRWFGGSIPIIFHIVLASFLFFYARHQLRLTSSRLNQCPQ